MSFTSTLLAYMRGELTGDDLNCGKFWFNCTREHVFSDAAPYEVTWLRPYDERPACVRSKVPIEALTQEEREKLTLFRLVIQEAEYHGRVSWRCDRKRKRPEMKEQEPATLKKFVRPGGHENCKVSSCIADGSCGACSCPVCNPTHDQENDWDAFARASHS